LLTLSFYKTEIELKASYQREILIQEAQIHALYFFLLKILKLLSSFVCLLLSKPKMGITDAYSI